MNASIEIQEQTIAFKTDSGAAYECLAYNHPGSDEALPVVLIHGLLMNIRFWWHDQIQQFGQDRPIYSIALAGHYPSTLPATINKIDDRYLADMIAEQLDTLVGDKPVMLVGHSTGALAALCFAIYHPERAHNLIILSTNPHGREDAGIFGFFQFLHLRMGLPGKWLFNLILKLNSISYPVHKYLLSDVAKNKSKMFAYPNFEAYIRRYLPDNKKLDGESMHLWFKHLYDIDIQANLGRITCPTLLMFSKNVNTWIIKPPTPSKRL